MRQLNEIMDRQNNSMPIRTIPKSTNGKITSIEIAEITGKPHNDVLKAIRVMEPAWIKVGGGNFSQTYYTDQWNRQQPMIELSKSECLYVATKFNDEARAKLVIRWEELEIEKHATKPLSQLDILAQSVQILQAQEKRITEVEDRVKVIEAKQTTHQNWFTIAGYGTLHKIQVGLKLAASLGRKACNLCKQRGIVPEEIPDPRFGKVKTYPEDVLKQVFEMPIN